MVKIPICIVLFLIGLTLIVGWWLAKCDRLAFIEVRGSEKSPEWLFFIGVGLVTGATWWGSS